MAPIVAPGVCRFAVNGLAAGRPVVNVLDYFIETTGSIVSREDACEAMAGIVMNEWTDSILPLLTDNYTAVSVSWLDLDSLTGSTGERTSTSEQSWPMQGEDTSNSGTTAIAARVNKVTVARRGQRQGRMYIGPVSEGVTTDANPNQIEPAIITSWNTVLEDFLGDTNQSDDTELDYTSRMVVLHTRNGAYEGISDVESLSLSPNLGTQVRRMRG